MIDNLNLTTSNKIYNTYQSSANVSELEATQESIVPSNFLKMH